MADHLLSTPSGRPRARALGIPLAGTPGRWNAITDVAGVEVGYTTLVEGESVRTGVTAVFPRGRDGVGVPCAAGTHSFNGNGEMTGTAWIAESGALNSPIVITNTAAVGPAHAGVVEWLKRNRPELTTQWALPVVAETYDGRLNDLYGGHVRPGHAVAALDAARIGPVEEGSVGGGTGMICHGFKGGSGTASRVLGYGPDHYTVAAFVQANHGARHELTIGGTPIRFAEPSGAPEPPPAAPRGAGSVIVVLATDAPLLPGQCGALARRATLGIGRTGTTGSHFSGDLFLAFSTANAGALTSTFPAGPVGDDEYEHLRFVPWGRIDAFYEAAVQAVEEAVLNALVANDDMTGFRGSHVPALPHDVVRGAFSAPGKI
ncbi:P1 family peptidase [Cryptosporangium arvum]|uniref:L-aminopeptidase/D-esterase n=1 Tax=Cryptosporangium arvum DSM 44712 TaxID=927661 RepID=A0A010ZRP1_9ACTN|nr:P1 family peptidase [Cryptosporangium arvum]EXG81284.1 L-aminopeptidase/D-esterase [Cryptosporangium arvum DSM 44712]